MMDRVKNRPSNTSSRLFRVGAVLLAGSFLLSGCAVKRMYQKNTEATHNESEASHYLDQVHHEPGLMQKRPLLREMNSIWVDTTPVELNDHSMGAKATALDCPVTFNPSGPVSIARFAQMVSASCGVPVHLSDDVIPALLGTLAKGGKASVGKGGAVSSAALPSPNLAIAGAAGGAVQTQAIAAPMSDTQGSEDVTGVSWVNKPMRGLLDIVTSRMGLGWKYEDHTITIFYMDTRVFSLYAIPTKVKMNTKVKSGAQSAQSSSGPSGSQQSGTFSTDGSAQSTEVDFSTNVLDDIQKTVQSMVTPGLGRLAVSPSSGTVTVTDRPQVLERIGQFIEQENKALTRQVVLNVKVLSVQISNGDSMGIDWNAVYTNLGQMSAGLGGTAAAGVTNLGNVQVINPNSHWNGTKAFINALSTQGKVSTLTSPTVRTLNLRPAPVLVGKQTTYLAQVSTTALSGGATGGSSTQSMTPGTVTTGFNMTLLPYLMQGQDMLLQYSVNLSALTSMDEISDKSGNKIQMPNIDNRIFSNTVRVKSGQTIVLSGFDQSTINAKGSGVGDPNFWLLGGNGSADKTHDVIVVLITPIITG